MSSLHDDDEPFHEEEDLHEEHEEHEEPEEDLRPAYGKLVATKLEEASAWLGTNVYPYIQIVKEPVGYVVWCVATFAVIAGLPTFKAALSDPYTDLSAALQANEAERQ